MITQDKVKIYNRYSGDIDSWARGGSKKDKLNMNDDDWYMIDEFIQDLSLVERGLASLTFDGDLNDRIKENCDSEETIQELKTIANNRKIWV